MSLRAFSALKFGCVAIFYGGVRKLPSKAAFICVCGKTEVLQMLNCLRASNKWPNFWSEFPFKCVVGGISGEIHYLMILSANWAYLKDASHLHSYQDIRMKEEQELQDIQSRSKECLNSYS